MCVEYPLDTASRSGGCRTSLLKRGCRSCIAIVRCDPFNWRKPLKVKDGKRLGADEVVISKNPGEMAAHANSFDFILDTSRGRTRSAVISTF
jgi:hypothetical protein